MYLSKTAQVLILFKRIATGWMIASIGLSTLSLEGWTILHLTKEAHTLSNIYTALGSSSVFVSLANIVYPWIFIISGVLIILGIWMRLSGILAIIILLFTYGAYLNIPFVDKYYLIDPYLLLAIIVSFLMSVRADDYWGLGASITLKKK